ncbi:hypothetical protein AAEX28_08520 [Lentisphaerota bacterium WC36G]|nr:hypothetical protein LJT99_11375 [Lentisphaerae bacterium WC36]
MNKKDNNIETCLAIERRKKLIKILVVSLVVLTISIPISGGLVGILIEAEKGVVGVNAIEFISKAFDIVITLIFSLLVLIISLVLKNQHDSEKEK